MKLVATYLEYFVSLGPHVVDVTCYILKFWFIIPYFSFGAQCLIGN